jgi:hypothetical protein
MMMKFINYSFNFEKFGIITALFDQSPNKNFHKNIQGRLLPYSQLYEYIENAFQGQTH